jgi:hypothetical protein
MLTHGELSMAEPQRIDPIPPSNAVRLRLARVLREARLLRSQLRVSQQAAKECISMAAEEAAEMCEALRRGDLQHARDVRDKSQSQYGRSLRFGVEMPDRNGGEQ